MYRDRTAGGDCTPGRLEGATAMNRNLYQTARYVAEAKLAEARYFRRAAEARTAHRRDAR
jgi:hypothetical protein